jgi:hypothetical protein
LYEYTIDANEISRAAGWLMISLKDLFNALRSLPFGSASIDCDCWVNMRRQIDDHVDAIFDSSGKEHQNEKGSARWIVGLSGVFKAVCVIRKDIVQWPGRCNRSHWCPSTSLQII